MCVGCSFGRVGVSSMREIFLYFFFFFFNDTATTEIYTLSLTTLFRSLSGSECRYEGGRPPPGGLIRYRSEEHTSELQSQSNLVCRLLLEKKKKNIYIKL